MLRNGGNAIDAAVTAALAAEAELDAFEPVPMIGPRTFTVPGALDLVERALDLHGTIAWQDAVEPARQLARDGFEVRATLEAAVVRMEHHLAADPVLRALYLPGDRPVRAGERVRNARLADALETVARFGARELYDGALGVAIAARSRDAGGHLDRDDLLAHRTLPMQPVSTTFQGADVWELPAPTQGPAVLDALAILEAAGRFEPKAIVDALLAGLRGAGVDLLSMQPSAPARGDTTYIAAIDEAGVGVSLITSVFADFGSVVGVDALGGPLQNRAAGSTLVGRRPSAGKPPHTTIPAVVTRDGALAHCLGVVGGYMQAQGQVQVLVNLLVHGMSAQAAIDAPRLRILAGGALAIEPGHPLAASAPDGLGRDPGAGGFGGCQVASVVDGRLDAGSDPRRGGAVARADAQQ